MSGSGAQSSFFVSYQWSSFFQRIWAIVSPKMWLYCNSFWVYPTRFSNIRGQFQTQFASRIIPIPPSIHSSFHIWHLSSLHLVALPSASGGGSIHFNWCFETPRLHSRFSIDKFTGSNWGESIYLNAALLDQVRNGSIFRLLEGHTLPVTFVLVLVHCFEKATGGL